MHSASIVPMAMAVERCQYLTYVRVCGTHECARCPVPVDHLARQQARDCAYARQPHDHDVDVNVAADSGQPGPPIRNQPTILELGLLGACKPRRSDWNCIKSQIDLVYGSRIFIPHIRGGLMPAAFVVGFELNEQMKC